MPVSPRLARPLRALGLLCCGFAALQACGGRSDTEDFLLNDDLPGGATSRGGSQNTGALGSGGTKPSKAGASSIGGTNVGGSGVGEGGATSVAGSSTTTTGGSSAQGGFAQGGFAQGGFAQGGSGVAGSFPAGGVGGTGVVVPITCGGQVCDALNQTCCATLGGFGCIPEGEACSGAVLNCGASSDCGGNQVCCLQIVGDTDSSSICKNNCAGMGPGRERQLCTSDDECRGNRRCRDTVFGVRVCTRF